MQTLGLLKEFAARGLHEDPLDTRLTGILLPRWATQVAHRVNSYAKWRWNEAFGEFTWPASGILYLPEHVDYPLSIYPGTNVSYTGTIEIVSAQQFDRGRPDYTTDGVIRLVVYGYYDIEADNPAANLIVVTGVAADQGMQVLIEGLDANGRARREIVTLNAAGTATTLLTFAAGQEGVRRAVIVTRATTAVAPAWGAGDIVVTSGGAVVATINSIYQNSVSCRRTHLHGASGAIPMRYSRRHRPLLRDSDIVEVPQEFEEVIELGIMMRLALFKQNPDEAAAYKGMMDRMMDELKAWDNRQPARTVVPSVLQR